MIRTDIVVDIPYPAVSHVSSTIVVFAVIVGSPVYKPCMGEIAVFSDSNRIVVENVQRWLNNGCIRKTRWPGDALPCTFYPDARGSLLRVLVLRSRIRTRGSEMTELGSSRLAFRA